VALLSQPGADAPSALREAPPWPWRADGRADRRCGLGGDLDLLAGGRVAALALLLRGLDAHGELHEPAHADLLGIAELLEDDLVQRGECSLGVGPGQLSSARSATAAINWVWVSGTGFLRSAVGDGSRIEARRPDERAKHGRG